MKDATKDFLQDALESELSENLGYDKYEHEKAIKNNYRNGYSKKKIKASESEIDLKIPRDRKGEFEPQIIPKYQRDISDLEHKVITMYAKWMSTRDIEDVIKDIYGISVNSSLVSRITDKILPKITEWNNLPLEKIYAAPTLESSKKALVKFEEKWKSKYNYAIKSWKNNFAELVTFFNFPPEIRKLIYTTHVIENQVKKWNSRIHNWWIILNQLMILFEDRFR